MTRCFARAAGRWACALALVALAGCGRGTTDVSGKVTYRGKAVTSGMVAFASPDGSAVYADIHGDGTYAAAGVPVGELKIAVSSPDPRISAQTNTDRNRFKTPAKKKVATPPGSWVALPPKYAQPDQSGLTVTATSKPTTHNITLD